MSGIETAITLVGLAVKLAPALERIVRAGVAADPNNPLAARVAAVLPPVSESERAANDLKR